MKDPVPLGLPLGLEDQYVHPFCILRKSMSGKCLHIKEGETWGEGNRICVFLDKWKKRWFFSIGSGQNVALWFDSKSERFTGIWYSSHLTIIKVGDRYPVLLSQQPLTWSYRYDPDDK